MGTTSPSGKSREGHRPLFPRYTRTSVTVRRLAIIEKGKITEHGGEVTYFSNFSELCDILNTRNLLTFIQDFSTWFIEYIDEAIVYNGCSILCNRYGDISSIKVAFGRSTRWIVLAKTWGEDCSIDFINHIDTFFDFVGIGTFNTPGSLGIALARESWRKNKLKFHTSPSDNCCEYIYKHQSGGAVHTPGLYGYYDEGVENDMDTVYLRYHKLLPTGTPVRYERTPSDKYFTWFGCIKVKIHYELSIGPFPVRKANGALWYPTKPGVYTTYVWREQYVKIMEAGCSVEFMGGYGWLGSTQDTLDLCQEMYYLRKHAPDDYCEAMMKLTIVAYLGRHGMHSDLHSLVPKGKECPEDVPVFTTDGKALNYFIHKEPNKFAMPMPHWFNYNIAVVSIQTYDFALPYAEKGLLLATNYDSVLTLGPGVDVRSVEKHLVADITEDHGHWYYKRLHGIYIPAPRAIECDEKSRRPGKVNRDKPRTESA